MEKEVLFVFRREGSRQAKLRGKLNWLARVFCEDFGHMLFALYKKRIQLPMGCDQVMELGAAGRIDPIKLL